MDDLPQMNVLLIGSGGREHALAWALAKSPLLETLYCAPGNGGIEAVAKCVAVDAADHGAVIAFCRAHDIDFVVVGPEIPLVAGLVDDLAQAGIQAFGPSVAAAKLEGSKTFTKQLCDEFNIPTARYGSFDNVADARAYVTTQGAPIVIKADGLAAGKGVIMAQTLDEALAAIDDCFAGSFGAAGAEVVVEEWLRGEEASFFALSDGKNIVPLLSAQDHKRAFDGDKGPNTGGMGAYAPAPIMTDELIARTMSEIIEPTVKGMAQRGTPFRGVLYAGLMITAEGPKLIEYNVRFGDPECQVLMLLLKSDLLPALLACAQDRLDQVTLEWHGGAALTVVMAAKGYPGAYDKGSEIKGLGKAGALPEIEIFHAGTARDGDKITAIGGRVLNVTARARDVGAAQTQAYAAVDIIDWPQGFYRSDIGWRAVLRENEGSQ